MLNTHRGRGWEYLAAWTLLMLTMVMGLYILNAKIDSAIVTTEKLYEVYAEALREMYAPQMAKM